MSTMEIRITNYVSIDPDYVWWNRYANAPILYNVDTGAPLPGSYGALESRGPIFMGDDYFVRIEQHLQGVSIVGHQVLGEHGALAIIHQHFLPGAQPSKLLHGPVQYRAA